MSNNVTVLIRQEMAKLQKQYNALAEALKVLEGGSSPAMATAAKAPATNSTGKRGRPKGSKKSKTQPAAKPAVAATPNVSPAPKVVAKKEANPVAFRPAKKSRKGAPKGKRKQRGINLNAAIREYIVTANRFVFSSELAEKFNSYYPEKSKSDFGKYISVLLSIAKAGKKLSATALDKNGQESRASYWGLPEWFANGKGKSEYYK